MSGHLSFVLGQVQRVRVDGTSPYVGSSVRTKAPSSAREGGLLRVFSLRGLPADVLLIVLYTALSRAFIGDEATLGIKIGPLPLFVTDAILLLLIAISLHKRGGRLLRWVFSGGGAGEIGRATWLLFLVAIVYCVAAFPRYQIMALHDLAIFGYCIFFPLTYFAFTRRIEAAIVVRYSIYATCLGAFLFNFQTVSGVHLFTLGANLKGLPGHVEIAHISANNLGAALGPGLAGLFAHLAVEREHRILHAGAILLCLATLAQLMDRSALLGFAMAGGLIFVLGVGRSRPYLATLAAVVFLLLLIGGQGELPIPGGTQLHNFWLSVSSGADMENDPDGQFRLERWGKTVAAWMTSPVFGVGFGAPIMLDVGSKDLHTEKKDVAERGALGAFNVGMPHNSFLMALARTGLVGLSFICFAWLSGIFRIVTRVIHGTADADQVACVAMLIAMISTAALNLFFERPMLCAPFWIILAASYRLSESVPQQFGGRPTRRVLNSARAPLPAPARPRRVSELQHQVAGAWQARWK
jgi:O-antigen ligase